MPLGTFEREVLRVMAANRNPDSFIGGATVLNQSPDSPRTSRDIDVFHDTSAALEAAAQTDQAALKASGFEVEIGRAFPGFVRALVRRGDQRTRVEWVFDSAFRFFPVEPDPELGYRLNFWDAATNKVLAASGRGEIRDYLDLLELNRRHLSLGGLAWAAAGKDEGLSPSFIVEELSRVQRYPAEAYRKLVLEQPADPAALKAEWLAALENARVLFETVLEKSPLGCLFLDKTGKPVTPTPDLLADLTPHFGSIRGCLPRIATPD